MSTNKSEHLQLHLWEPGDSVLRTEFNENWEKIDASAAQAQADLTNGLDAITAVLNAGGKLARIAWGSYTGNGKYGSSNKTKLTFDFTPRLVFVGSNEDAAYDFNRFMYPHTVSSYVRSGATFTVTWGSSSIQWYNSSDVYQLNESGKTYYYVAVGFVQE